MCVYFQTGYNLVVCAYALGDREGMKDAFLRLLTVRSLEVDEEEEAALSGLIGREEEDMPSVSGGGGGGRGGRGGGLCPSLL